MTDKLNALRRDHIRGVIGAIDAETVDQLPADRPQRSLSERSERRHRSGS